MRFYNFLIIIVLFIFNSFDASAQLEIGVYGGGANYQGDIISNKINEIAKHTHGAYGFLVGYGINDYVTLRFNLGKAFVSASDAYASEDNKDRRLRNLSFFSDITEGSLKAEINLLGYAPNTGGRRFSPYISIGLTMFKFDPKTNYNNQIVSLQPIGTEGQTLPDANKTPYKLTQFAIPIGGGVKFAISENINIGLDVTTNRTFTDYLDDVSGTYADPAALKLAGNLTAIDLANRQWEVTGEPAIVNANQSRGNNAASDWYFTYTFRMSFNLSKGKHSGKGEECFKF